ncbi:hypothetical protein RUND412_001433 [Rhizina undulata]
MTSPVKRRKKNLNSNPVPTKGTIDYFFRQKPQGSDSKPPKPSSDSANCEGQTDEEYARKLAEQIAKEDGVSGNVPGSPRTTAREYSPGEGSSKGVKRRRSSSDQEARDFELAKRLAAEDEDDVESGDKKETVLEKRKQKDVGECSKRSVSGKGKEKDGNSATPSPEKLKLSLEPAIINLDEITESIPLDSEHQNFCPEEYSHVLSSWPCGKAPYALLTRAFVIVSSTKKRLKIRDTLVNFLRLIIKFDPESVLPAVWLITNSIGPAYENNELGIGPSILKKALLKVSGITPATLKRLHNKHGDPGDVAFEVKVKQRTLGFRKPAPLTIQYVYETLTKIASTFGKGSQETKGRHVERLFLDAKGEEIRFLTRTLIKNLRIGAEKTTMLTVLARAFSLTAPQNASGASEETQKDAFQKAEETLKQTFARRPNYNDLIPALLRGGVENLKECGIAVHVPLRPMLGKITKDLGEMLVLLEGREFACEYKYDGQRAQVHCDSEGRVSIFSRNLELMTGRYPDIVELVPRIRGEGVESFIMEGEIVAIDRETGSVRPFQELATRGRKEVDLKRISVDVCFFAFDLMFLNGQELLSAPFRHRRNLLRNNFTSTTYRFTPVTSLDATTSDADRIHEFFNSALSFKCEGIMTKVLDNYLPTHLSPISSTALKKDRRKPLLATYEPDKRLESWLKVKKDYTSTSPTLDLVPIAAWHGQGRKSSWWSPILLAIYNPATESFDAACKCMSGFTDKTYASIKEFYSPDSFNVSAQKKAYYNVPESLHPAVWFEPKEVWEVAFADVTVSPVYTAAAELMGGKGLSLRFPRFLRRREDKAVEDASTPEELRDLYLQEYPKGEEAMDMDGDEEYENGGEKDSE